MKTERLQTRIVSWALVPEGEPISDMRGFTVSIEDDGDGGEYIKIINNNADSDEGVTIDPEEWEDLRALINAARNGCRETKPAKREDE